MVDSRQLGVSTHATCSVRLSQMRVAWATVSASVVALSVLCTALRDRSVATVERLRRQRLSAHRAANDSGAATSAGHRAICVLNAAVVDNRIGTSFAYLIAPWPSFRNGADDTPSVSRLARGNIAR